MMNLNTKFQEEKDMKEKLLTTKNVVLMGMFGALAGVLMLFTSKKRSRENCQL